MFVVKIKMIKTSHQQWTFLKLYCPVLHFSDVRKTRRPQFSPTWKSSLTPSSKSLTPSHPPKYNVLYAKSSCDSHVDIWYSLPCSIYLTCWQFFCMHIITKWILYYPSTKTLPPQHYKHININVFVILRGWSSVLWPKITIFCICE